MGDAEVDRAGALLFPLSMPRFQNPFRARHFWLALSVAALVLAAVLVRVIYRANAVAARCGQIKAGMTLHDTERIMARPADEEPPAADSLLEELDNRGGGRCSIWREDHSILTVWSDSDGTIVHVDYLVDPSFWERVVTWIYDSW
jgi:hypothetical protein